MPSTTIWAKHPLPIVKWLEKHHKIVSICYRKWTRIGPPQNGRPIYIGPDYDYLRLVRSAQNSWPFKKYCWQASFVMVDPTMTDVRRYTLQRRKYHMERALDDLQSRLFI